MTQPHDDSPPPASSGGARPTPASVDVGEAAITIVWKDGHQSVYPHLYLRLRCHCATCVGEGMGRHSLDPSTVPENVIALEYMQVGRYALQFLWSDAHYTGIYPFDALRESCPCTECAVTTA